MKYLLVIVILLVGAPFLSEFYKWSGFSFNTSSVLSYILPLICILFLIKKMLFNAKEKAKAEKSNQKKEQSTI